MNLLEKTHLQIIKKNKELLNITKGNPFNITFLSNITFNKIKDVLEFPLRSNGINAHVKIGNYDNIIQDSIAYQNSDVVIIHQELFNFTNDLGNHLLLDQNNYLITIANEIKSQIDLILSNLRETKLVIFNKYSSYNFVHDLDDLKSINKLTNDLNTYLDSKLKEFKNLRVIGIDQITIKLGIHNSVDYKSYYAFRDLYRTPWIISYVNTIQHIIYSITGKIKKAMVLDCDNTLWKGILGEDGYNKIEMSPKTKSGEIFNYVQKIILQLSQKGILVCLCSKNNEDDVNEVISSHSNMLLRDANITLKKINWNDKASNIKDISKELNIGLDSIIFVDDSDFEINLIKESLPEVLTFQVPKNLSDYPTLINNITNYFYRHEVTQEDLDKAEEYKNQAIRNQEKSSFSSIEDYIKSLEIKISIFKDDPNHLARMEQMAQKTNQFNFTTIRHTSIEIEKYINEPNAHTYCINVEDKFGDSGMTGLIITKRLDDKTFEITSFLMSCRIIGRNIEHAFLNYVIDDHKKEGFSNIKSSYVKSQKNQQVNSFYEELGFKIETNTEERKTYSAIIDQIKFKNVEYIRRK